MGKTIDRSVTGVPERGALAKMVMKLLDHWQLSMADQAVLLGIAATNLAVLTRYRLDDPIEVTQDQYDRIVHLLEIHKCLRLLFPHNRDLAYRWMATGNIEFDNLTPVEVIKDRGFAGLLSVRCYLERAKSA